MNVNFSTRRFARTTLTVAGLVALSLPAFAGAVSQNTPAAGVVATQRTGAATRVLPPALRPVFYRSLVKDAGTAYNVNAKGCATLPRQRLTACFNGSGVHFTGASSLALHLVGYGRGDALSPVKAVQPAIAANQVSYAHGSLAEWWRVLPIGFEQGFTIAKRPGGKGTLTLALAASNPAVQRSGALGWGKLRYGDLVVTDAHGKVVPAMLKSGGGRVLIAVNDAHAVYPLTVDPLVWLEQKVTASDGAAGDDFGSSVAVSGTTALVGAWLATVNGNPHQGAVYVFAESGGAWTQTQKLTASDGAVGDQFGTSVALSGTTALVGAPYATVNGNYAQGAAYVFGESGGSWTQTAKLSASDGAASNDFGYAVALSGTAALIGAPYATVNGNGAQGAAYVFGEAGGSWTQTAKLTASDGAASNYFGYGVALSGITALIDAPVATVNGNSGQGAAYVFGEAGGSWTQTAKLTASDGAPNDYFGYDAVALSGTTALIGEPFATVNGNSGQGAAYVFAPSGATWVQAAKLTASDGAAGDSFGGSVALSGATALVGAYATKVNDNYGQGVAYVFGESGGSWTQAQKLIASDGAANDAFGYAVALSDTTALISAPNTTVNGNAVQGVAYFEGQSALGLAVSAPQTVGQGQNYVSQTIATNNASAASPAVTATVTVPAAASFVSATASQGTCSEASNLVTCDFGQVPGNAGTATANVTLKATGSPDTTIDNTASVALAEPALTAGAPTQITSSQSCPAGYTTYTGTLAANAGVRGPSYEAPAGVENAILYAPTGFQLYAVYQNGQTRKVLRIPGNEVHRHGPAGTYTWGLKAGATGGAYTFCLNHP